MTAPDTSREAMERLIDGAPQPDSPEAYASFGWPAAACDMLRALLAERDALRAEYSALLAENDALRFMLNNAALSPEPRHE